MRIANRYNVSFTFFTMFQLFWNGGGFVDENINCCFKYGLKMKLKGKVQSWAKAKQK